MVPNGKCAKGRRNEAASLQYLNDQALSEGIRPAELRQAMSKEICSGVLRVENPFHKTKIPGPRGAQNEQERDTRDYKWSDGVDEE